jgi:flagellar FliJ protein
MAFRFRLATVQRLREAARDARRGELAQALRAAEMLRARREEIEAQLQATRGEIARRSAPGAADVDALMAAHRYEQTLRAERAGVQQQEKQVQAELERRRDALVEADRAVRVLEMLHERRAAEYQTSEDRREQRELDQIAVLRASRSGGDG